MRFHAEPALADASIQCTPTPPTDLYVSMAQSRASNLRVASSFWVFGLLNNVLYVVILSAAIDLVGATTPKGVVLLADVLPALIAKVTAPFYIQRVPYSLRIFCLIGLSFGGMQLIAAGQSFWPIMIGICMASLSSGFGEITFLALTHYYDRTAVHGFSSGTGAAGLVGSFLFMLATTWLHISTRWTLIFFSISPFAFLLVFFKLLPPRDYVPLDIDLNSDPQPQIQTIDRIKPLVKPFIIPLMLVYIGEYVINQGISPTLLFDLEDMPFSAYRDAYVTYSTLYQVGVFISRSSAPWVRIHQLYLPAFLQLANVGICILQSMFMIFPSIYIVFVLMIYEGLLGGAAYVNTYMQVTETVPASEREFAMATVGMSDSAGITLAGLLSLWLEPTLCHYQLQHGRPWCQLA